MPGAPPPLLRDYEGTSLDSVQQMAGLGLGLAILPEFYIRSEVGGGGVQVLEIAGWNETRSISAAWRAGAASCDLYLMIARQIQKEAALLALAPSRRLLGSHHCHANVYKWVGSGHSTGRIQTADLGPEAECLHSIGNTDKADAVVRISGTSASAPIADVIRFRHRHTLRAVRRTQLAVIIFKAS